MAHAQVLFKMDKAGDGQVVELEDLCMNRELSFVGFTPQMFMEVGQGLQPEHCCYYRSGAFLPGAQQWIIVAVQHAALISIKLAFACMLSP